MAEWKKVIVSGSDANLASLQVDNLITGVVTGSADGTLGIQAINGTGNILATTGATGVVISGSFSGSFFGNGGGLTNISASSIVGLTQIATGSVTASVNVGTNAFTVASESIQLFNVRANGGVEHGVTVTAYGDYSHAEGYNTLASGSYSHAEGYNTISSGSYSHAEGDTTLASGDFSHAEGYNTISSGSYSHAEGSSTTASGWASHAEGSSTEASGQNSHAEGDSTTASGLSSHAEGVSTIASGQNSHAEGSSTQAIGDSSHAEGFGTKTGGNNGYLAISVVAGLVTLSGSYGDVSADYPAGNYLYLNDSAYDNSYTTVALIIDSTSFNGTETEILLVNTSGGTTTAIVGNINLNPTSWTGDQVYGALHSHAEGDTTLAIGAFSHAEGGSAVTFGFSSHAEGNTTIASGIYSHAEGYYTTAYGVSAHAEGANAIASGSYSHAEGDGTIAAGTYSHAEGEYTTASGNGSHAEGYSTTTSGQGSHAEGEFAIASGYASHAEGLQTTASGSYSHAEGEETVAYGYASHAEGLSTIASGSGQLAAGRYNTHNNTNSLVVIGNGVDDANRSDLALFNSQSITFNQPVTGSIFSGSFIGTFSGSTDLPDLTEGTGIVPFIYDGGSTATVAISGAAALSDNTVVKWDTGDGKFLDTTITDDGTLVTFSGDALFQGDITVQGTASFQNTENLLVADRFVLFGSGSNSAGDGGIVVQQGVQNVGELFGYENSADRWGFTSSFDASSTSYTPAAFVAAVIDIGAGQSDIAQYQKNGNIKIDTGDIWIYA